MDGGYLDTRRAINQHEMQHESMSVEWID